MKKSSRLTLGNLKVAIAILLCFLSLKATFGAAGNQPVPSVLEPVGSGWRHSDNFRKWLHFINQTSTPYSLPDAETGPYTSNSSPQMARSRDSQTNSTEDNVFQARRIILVDQLGRGHCLTIQEAVSLVPRHNRERVIIRIRPGVYREKVTIPKYKPYITLQGHKNLTIVTYNSTAGDVWFNQTKAQNLRTYNSATVAVNSRFFIAKSIIFKNSAPLAPPGSVGKQGVALRISADMAAFYDCQFFGAQDTLYDHHGRHYFKNCYVEGTVDFVFGNGRSFYRNCVLNALNNSGNPGFLTAQKRNETTLDTGFSFVDSRISGSGQVYLGRAWGNNSRVVFARSYMDRVVLPVGWNDWGNEWRDRSSFYAEFNCTGPGATTNSRAPWARLLSPEEAKPFISLGFINGERWLPPSELDYPAEDHGGTFHSQSVVLPSDA